MRIAAIIALLAAGIMAGAQLGKIAPLVGWYRTDAGFTLVQAGWLAALIAAFVAIAALPAGWAIHRVGTRRATVWSFAILAIGGLALAYAASPAAVLGARLIEGVGYLALVIAVPALLSTLSPVAWRPPVLAVWGGFVPIGFAVANFLADGVIPIAGPKFFLLAVVLLFVAFALLSVVLLPLVNDLTNGESEAAGETFGILHSLPMPVILLAMAFGAYVVSSIGFFTFMPTFVAETGDRFLVSAGVIALLVPLGNLLAGVLLHGRSERFAVLLGGFGFLVTILLSIPAFSSADPLVATASATAIAIAGGIVASALFAGIPLFVPKGGSVSIAIGLVAQAGGIGTLIGPPLAGWIIETMSWPALGLFLSAAAAVGLVCLIPLARPAATAPYRDQ